MQTCEHQRVSCRRLWTEAALILISIIHFIQAVNDNQKQVIHLFSRQLTWNYSYFSTNQEEEQDQEEQEQKEEEEQEEQIDEQQQEEQQQDEQQGQQEQDQEGEVKEKKKISPSS